METLGKIAYEAYCQTRQWKSFDDKLLPSWDQMVHDSPHIANAWECAANAVAAHLANQRAPG